MIPAEALRPVVLPVAADDLACEALWPPEARLCFRVWQDGVRRMVVKADLAAWSADVPALKAALREPAVAHLAEAELVPIGGMEPAKWLRLVDGDGWAAAGAVRPELLAERLGGLPIRVAFPSEGVLVAWRTGDPAVDRVMAVGVREIHAEQPDKVTDHVWQWDGKAWMPFGRAVPSQ